MIREPYPISHLLSPCHPLHPVLQYEQRNKMYPHQQFTRRQPGDS